MISKGTAFTGGGDTLKIPKTNAKRMVRGPGQSKHGD